MPAISRSSIVELANIGALSEPEISTVGGLFVPSFEVSGVRTRVLKIDGDTSAYKGLGACRNFVCSLGFKEFEISE